MELNKFMGMKIRERREQRMLTQAQLAEKMHTSQATINRYENGTRNINSETLFDLGNALKVDVQFFYPETEQSKSKTITPEEAIKNIRSADGKGIDPAEYDKVLQVLSAFLTKEGVKNG